MSDPIVARVVERLYGDDDAPPTSLPITHVPLAPFDTVAGVQRKAGSKDSRITAEGHYLARIFGEWYMGQFSEQWYGWSFQDWGTSGIQLDAIEDLYEIDLTSLP
jgi:hypothetical protein